MIIYIVLYGQTLFYIAQAAYYLQYKHPAKALSMVIMLHSYLHVLNYLAGPQLHVAYVTFS